eukprot:366301-Chlamydomonas_euryale.AAC.39
MQATFMLPDHACFSVVCINAYKNLPTKTGVHLPSHAFYAAIFLYTEYCTVAYIVCDILGGSPQNDLTTISSGCQYVACFACVSDLHNELSSTSSLVVVLMTIWLQCQLILNFMQHMHTLNVPHGEKRSVLTELLRPRWLAKKRTDGFPSASEITCSWDVYTGLHAAFRCHHAASGKSSGRQAMEYWYTPLAMINGV